MNVYTGTMFVVGCGATGYIIGLGLIKLCAWLRLPAKLCNSHTQLRAGLGDMWREQAELRDRISVLERMQKVPGKK